MIKELKDVKELWHTDWYDGPLAGVCEYQGKICWYLLTDAIPYEKDGKKYNRYKYQVYKITDEEIEKQKIWRDLEEKFGAMPSNYRHISNPYWRFFSENYYKDPEVKDENIIGFTYLEEI